ncbi:Sucrase/ferredoxin-like-domain-containing protein [Lipomyces orientalis]|uniref:Sucrase/ferredoxin-like-domain-containing protein n=1 Tax=Lipomyces orientalis TaxID=1233043 RepID=A0ACC3TXD9_9ASCO
MFRSVSILCSSGSFSRSIVRSSSVRCPAVSVTSARLFSRTSHGWDDKDSIFVEKCPAPVFDSGCTYCRPEFPADKPVKIGAALNGTAPIIGRHLLVSTGHADWPSRTEFDLNSLDAQVRALQQRGVRRDPDFNFMITSTDLSPANPPGDQSWSLYMYPDGLYFPRVPYSKGEAFIKRYLIPSRSHEAESIEDEIDIVREECPIVAICAHAARDARCGIVGPMLKAEFEQVLRSKGLLYDPATGKGIRVTLVSHVGGHAYAGNIIYFRGDGSAVWYGLAYPEHVQGIVKETIEGGRIIRELYRGGLSVHS